MAEFLRPFSSATWSCPNSDTRSGRVTPGVARHLKAELRRADMTYEVLALKLQKHGFEKTKASIANKLPRCAVRWSGACYSLLGHAARFLLTSMTSSTRLLPRTADQVPDATSSDGKISPLVTIASIRLMTSFIGFVSAGEITSKVRSHFAQRQK
jgi:Domain of unknown function (DUF6471)